MLCLGQTIDLTGAGLGQTYSQPFRFPDVPNIILEPDASYSLEDASNYDIILSKPNQIDAGDNFYPGDESDNYESGSVNYNIVYKEKI